MDYKSLQALAKDMGVSAAGKAEDIIARIVAVEVDVPEGELTEEEKALFEEEAARQEEERAAGGQTVEEAEDTAGEPQTGQETTEEGAAEENTKDAKKPQEEAGKAAVFFPYAAAIFLTVTRLFLSTTLPSASMIPFVIWSSVSLSSYFLTPIA